jgi:hypothetical protein
VLGARADLGGFALPTNSRAPVMATKRAPPSWSRMVLATVMSVIRDCSLVYRLRHLLGDRARDTSPDAAMIASRLASSSVVQ